MKAHASRSASYYFASFLLESEPMPIQYVIIVALHAIANWIESCILRKNANIYTRERTFGLSLMWIYLSIAVIGRRAPFTHYTANEWGHSERYILLFSFEDCQVVMQMRKIMNDCGKIHNSQIKWSNASKNPYDDLYMLYVMYNIAYLEFTNPWEMLVAMRLMWNLCRSVVECNWMSLHLY